MQEFNVDLTMIAAIWMGAALLMVPLVGLTARFGFKPLLDSVARMRASDRATRDQAEQDARYAALERRVRELTRAVDRLNAESRREHAVVS